MYWFTEGGVQNFKRVLSVATRVRPKIKPLAGNAAKLLENAKGKALHTVIFGRKKEKGQARPLENSCMTTYPPATPATFT